MRIELEHILTNSPNNAIPGVGMSTRPEFYSGRGVTASDLTAGHLVRIYNRILHGSAFPKGAADAFVQMVLNTPTLSATAFIRNMHRLDEQNFKWSPSGTDQSDIELGPNDGTGAREFIGTATIWSRMFSPQSEAQAAMLSRSMKYDFLRQIGKSDLMAEDQEDRYAKRYDGTWDCGG